jgi:hypothetical protein
MYASIICSSNQSNSRVEGWKWIKVDPEPPFEKNFSSKLAASRGVVIGAVVGILIWVLIVWIVAWMVRK